MIVSDKPLSIGEGRTTISMIKVHGFFGSEITGSILNVNHILVLFGYLFAGFVIIWLAYEMSLLLQKRKLAKIDRVEALKDNRRNE